MILSYKHKFVYVKGQKVAGTSLEIILSKIVDQQDIVTPIAPADEYQRLSLGGKCQNYCSSPKLEAAYLDLVQNKEYDKALNTGVHSPNVSTFYNHMPLSVIEHRVNVSLDKYSILVLERNPYAKIISFANMILSYSQYKGEAMENTFDDIRRTIKGIFLTGQYKSVYNIDLYRSGKNANSLIVMRQENFENDVNELFEQLALGEPPKELPHAKRGIDSNRLDPRTIFSRQQLDTINQVFLEEFRAFEYEQV